MIRHERDAVRSLHDMEVSCESNPTQLFLLMNQQLWDNAQSRLMICPEEARTWISSRSPETGEYRWCNLPLHLACLHGPEPVPLHFLETLISMYPEGVRCRNHEGNMPIHMACDCVSFNLRFRLEEEGILITLISAFPECLSAKDGIGRTPLDILDERSLGRGLGIIKYMKSHAIETTKAEDTFHEAENERIIHDHLSMRKVSVPKRRKHRRVSNPAAPPPPIQHHHQQMLVEPHINPASRVNISQLTYPSAVISPHSVNASLSQQNELQERLYNLEIEYAKLKNDYVNLSSEHSNTESKLEETRTVLQLTENELALMKRRESNVSGELALKLRLEERQCEHIQVLRNELDKEKDERLLVVKKLDNQIKKFVELQEVSNCESERLLHENARLSSANKECSAQLVEKKRQLQESTKKEAALLGLISKMHDIPSSVTDESNRLLTENSKLRKGIRESNAKVSKLKALLAKAKEALASSHKRNQLLQLQMNELEIESQRSALIRRRSLIAPEAEKLSAKERESLTLHLQKLELLSKAITSLPRLNTIDIDANRDSLRLHLKKVDDVTATLDIAMQIAVQDARKLVVGHETTTAQKKQDHTEEPC